jgi:anti-sigma factor ChrR (cupin superfamily)
MISEEQQEQASLYVLGALNPEETAAFEAEMAKSVDLRELTLSLQSAIAMIARAMPGQLPSSLRGKIMQRLDSLEQTVKPPPSIPPGLKFLAAAAETGWKPLPIPGAFIKVLSVEREHNYAVLLGKLEPGARYPAHIHAGSEDFYILSGDLFIGNHKLLAGDFHHAAKGSRHEENYSVEGCTLIAVLTLDDPLVAFAMS